GTFVRRSSRHPCRGRPRFLPSCPDEPPFSGWGYAKHAAGGGLISRDVGLRAEWLGTALMTGGALVAFAANSLLCRIALEGGSIDAPSFATIRIVSGALLLLALLRLRGAGHEAARTRTDWI